MCRPCTSRGPAHPRTAPPSSGRWVCCTCAVRPWTGRRCTRAPDAPRAGWPCRSPPGTASATGTRSAGRHPGPPPRALRCRRPGPGCTAPYRPMSSSSTRRTGTASRAPVRTASGSCPSARWAGRRGPRPGTRSAVCGPASRSSTCSGRRPWTGPDGSCRSPSTPTTTAARSSPCTARPRPRPPPERPGPGMPAPCCDAGRAPARGTPPRPSPDTSTRTNSTTRRPRCRTR